MTGTKVRRRGAKRTELDPIEKASRDEIAALQRKRIRWTLRHAYENVPHYRRTFRAANDVIFRTASSRVTTFCSRT